MSDCDADPWQVKNNDSIEQQINGNNQVIEKFEDNFNPNKVETQTRKSEGIQEHKTESNVTSSQLLEPLPDSANYLQLLGNIKYIICEKNIFQIYTLLLYSQRED